MGLFVQNIHVCLGGLFVPEAYITATRQYVAQANSWSLEELCLEVNVTASQSTTLDACSFGVTGELESERGLAFLWNLFPNECTECLARAAQLSLRVSRKLGCVALDSFSPSPHLLTGLKLQGATCSNNKLSLSNAISTVLPLTQLRWGKQTSAEKKASVVSVKASLLGSAWVMVGLHLRGNSPELPRELVPRADEQ